MAVLLRLDREITSNPCLSVCFIGLGILAIESFLLAINLDVMSFFSVFSSLIYVFRCKGITILTQLNFFFHYQKKEIG